MNAEINKAILISCYQELLYGGNFSEWNDYYDEIFDGGWSLLLEDWNDWVADSCLLHLPGQQEVTGLEQLKTLFAKLRCANIKVSVSNLLAEGDLVSVHGFYSHLPSKETEFANHNGQYMALFSISEGRVNEGWVVYS